MISFRPHHFLCTLGFQGKGYSPSFIKNYKGIVETLQKNPRTLLHVVSTTDSICMPCPHRQEQKCAKEAQIQALDKRHSKILNIKFGDILNWSQGKERLKKHMTLAAFHRACKGCQWKFLGVCETALKALHRD